MNTEDKRRMQSIGLYIISLYSPKTSFKKHVEMIRDFITSLIHEAAGSKDDKLINCLEDFNELFDYFIHAEKLKDELSELENLLNAGKFLQERGSELLLDSIMWHHQFESLMKRMKGRKNSKVFESFYNSLMDLHYKVSHQSKEIAEVIHQTIKDLDKGELY